MPDRPFDALLLDLDGTLLTRADELHPATPGALAGARERGVRVMIVTGRSKIATLPVIEELGLDTRTVLFNGAAVWCPTEGRLVEERTFSNDTLERLLEHGRRTGDMTIVMCANRKLGLVPRSEVERRSLDGLQGLELVPREELHAERVIRMTFISERHESSAAHAAEVERAVRRPVYMTHFPLSMLPRHRSSSMQAVDVHPPCAGKAEALRVLEETYGIAAGRVVAVGDATNDAPMVIGAGLGVAMANAMAELKAVADRVIGDHDGPAIAELVEELFL